MEKIKHTKNELKAQREALNRFERFLPMLQLKKQQLQGEIIAADTKIAALRKQESEVRQAMTPWLALLSEPVELEKILTLKQVVTTTGNIAGVAIPLFKDVVIEKHDYDLFETPPWLDDGVETLERMIRLSAERGAVEEQRRLIAEELRTTSQRVNLFEKVKIPACKEHIRIIKIFLGDEQTAGVARAKIAKSRAVLQEVEETAA